MHVFFSTKYHDIISARKQRYLPQSLSVIYEVKGARVFTVAKCCYGTFLTAGGAVDHRSGGTRPVNISVSKAMGAGMHRRALIGRAPHQFAIPPSDWKRCAVTGYDTTAVQYNKLESIATK